MEGYRYRLHAQDGEVLGVLAHPTSNLEPEDEVTFSTALFPS
jgi:hypothetical protein